MISNGKKAAIHIAANHLGLSKKEYQAELKDAVGVTSSLDLTDKTFAIAMNHFRALGYVGQKSKYFRIIENLPRSDRRVMSKINAIRLDMDLSWRYVDSVAKKVSKVDAVQFAHGKALQSVLSAMVIHQKRQKRRD